MNHTGNYPGVGIEERERLIGEVGMSGEVGMFGKVDKDVGQNEKVGDSYILRGLNGKLGVEDLMVGMDRKEGLNEK